MENDTQRAIGRIEGMIGGIVTGLADLKNSFETMEKGRLTRLEVAFATLETELTLKSKNSALIYSLIASIVASVISAGIIYLLLPK